MVSEVLGKRSEVVGYHHEGLVGERIVRGGSAGPN